MLGSKSAQAIEDMVGYAQETQHEKILRGLAVGIALVMYGRMEEADALIESLCRDKVRRKSHQNRVVYSMRSKMVCGQVQYYVVYILKMLGMILAWFIWCVCVCWGLDHCSGCIFISLCSLCQELRTLVWCVDGSCLSKHKSLKALLSFTVW